MVGDLGESVSTYEVENQEGVFNKKSNLAKEHTGSC